MNFIKGIALTIVLVVVFGATGWVLYVFLNWVMKIVSGLDIPTGDLLTVREKDKTHHIFVITNNHMYGDDVNTITHLAILVPKDADFSTFRKYGVGESKLPYPSGVFLRIYAHPKWGGECSVKEVDLHLNYQFKTEDVNKNLSMVENICWGRKVYSILQTPYDVSQYGKLITITSFGLAFIVGTAVMTLMLN